MYIVWALLLLLVLASGWILTLLAMPGNWLMVASAAVYVLLVPKGSPAAIGWGAVTVLLALALVGEMVELVAAALGVARIGGSRRGALLALLGSMAGAMAGVIVGLPIPVVGPVVAAVLFACLGALAGAMFGETWKGRSLGESWRIGKGAFWGRLLGTATKVIIASVMVVFTFIALVWK
jgi:uncharacterized protein YqgC (DUF456 family)